MNCTEYEKCNNKTNLKIEKRRRRKKANVDRSLIISIASNGSSEDHVPSSRDADCASLRHNVGDSDRFFNVSLCVCEKTYRMIKKFYQVSSII